MKSTLIAIILFLILPNISFSQERQNINEVIEVLTKNSKIDSSDKKVYALMDDFFYENLQAETPQLSQKTISTFNSLMVDSTIKNQHLLALFLFYQNHISESMQTGKTNPQFQVAVIEALSNEYKKIYQRVPVIIYVYQVEAYNSNKQIDKVKETLLEAREAYPDAVPLKVYQFLAIKDDQVKEDLLQNHSNHWLVKSFKIN